MTPRKPSPDGDRRRAARVRPTDHNWEISAQVFPGLAVSILDLSSTGILVESTLRLFPGGAVSIRLSSARRCVQLGARVVRCHVAGLDASKGIIYRAALTFDREITMPRRTPQAGTMMVGQSRTDTDTSEQVA